MSSIEFRLPSGLRAYVERRVSEGGYASVSEYTRELIRADLRQTAQSQLESQLLAGLASGRSQRMTRADWKNIRFEVRRRLRDK